MSPTNPPLLVETEWLAVHLEDPNLRIVDGRWYGDLQVTKARFAERHIPGAVHLDWRHDLAHTENGVIDILLPPEPFAEAMSNAGIGDDTLVVAYGETDHGGPQRLWWALKTYGHEKVTVLNGGLTKWLAEGRPVSAGPAGVVPAVFTPRSPNRLLATIEDVRAGLRHGSNTAFFDNRPVEQYDGRALWTPFGSILLAEGEEWKTVEGQTLRAGHLPGAVNIPATDLFDPETWTFPDPERLRAKLEAAGISPGQKVITYCGVGISASTGMFALKLAGYENVALYDASWSEWARDPKNPVVK